jgi:hypothetical protein
MKRIGVPGEGEEALKKGGKTVAPALLLSYTIGPLGNRLRPPGES